MDADILGNLAGIRELLQQHARRLGALIARRLLERREGEHLRELVIVDPDDAQGARHRDAEATGCDDGTDGDFVAGGQECGGAALGVSEQIDRRRVAAREGHLRPDVRLGQARLGHRRPIARQARPVDVGALGDRDAADERDLGVPELDEMSCRASGCVLVIQSHDARAVTDGNHAHDRTTDGDESLELVIVRLQADGDQPIESLSGQEVVEDTSPTLRPRLGVVEGEVIAGLEQHLLNALENLGEEPPVQVGHDDTDVARASCREARSARRRNVSQLLGDASYALPGGRRNVPVPGESTTCRRFRDSRSAGYVLDAAHVVVPSGGDLRFPTPHPRSIVDLL